MIVPRSRRVWGHVVVSPIIPFQRAPASSATNTVCLEFALPHLIRHTYPRRLCLMALFDVPGWGVPGAPVAEAQNSRKRKRPSAPNGDKVATATVNLEKLMRKLDPVGDTSRPVSTKNQRSKKAKGTAGQDKKTAPRRTSPERPRKKEPPQKRTREETSSSPHDPPSRKKTKKNANAKGESQGPAASMSAKPSKGAPPKSKEGLTVLQAGMKNSLEGARFRQVQS